MSAVCCYVETVETGQRCEGDATHVALGGGATWVAHRVMASELTEAPRRTPEFCALHAGVVAQGRVLAWQQAAQAPKPLKPRPGERYCAVCCVVLDDTAETLRGVGLVCAACHEAAESEQALDPRVRPARRKSGRKKTG